MRVEIYIQARTKNPAVQKMAQARWLIRSVANNGQEVRKDGAVVLNNATEKRAVLQALKDALERFTKAAVIKVYVSDDYVRNMLLSNMPKRWRENDWHKIRKNAELIHSDLWRALSQLLANHAVSFATTAECFDNTILKEMEEKLNGR